MTCTNSKCGIIYTNIVDDAAEWRFYGNGDNPGTDFERFDLALRTKIAEDDGGEIFLEERQTRVQMKA